MNGRSQVIDAFRGVAVLSVMTYHYLHEWAPVSGIPTAGLDWLALGKLGVDLFFIISGLVIAMTVLKVASAREFAVRRFARLYPAFLATATLVFLTLSLIDPLKLRVGLADYFANWTMLAGDLGFRYVDGIFWTLAVEAKFYVWVALSWAVLRKRFWLGLVAVGAAGALLYPLAPVLADHLLLARYIPFFLIGIAGWYGLIERQAAPAAVLGLVGLVLYGLRAGAIAPSPHLALAAHVALLGSAGALFCLLALWPSAPGGPLALVGRASYSLYLIHQYLGVTAIHLLVRTGVPAPAAIAAVFLAAIGLAWLFFRYVEQPGQRLVLHALAHKHREHRPPQHGHAAGDGGQPHRLGVAAAPAANGSPG